MNDEENSYAGRRVLVVEDDQDLRELVGDAFRMMGAEVMEAENGRVAFELFQSAKFDAVVSDMRMPEVDGMALLMNIRKIGSAPPFIFLTGYSDVTPDEAKRRGAQLTIVKPFDTEHLLHSVMALLAPAS